VKLTMSLSFVAASEAPAEWKDGRQLMAFGDDDGGFEYRKDNVFRVVVWAGDWQVCEAVAPGADANWTTSVDFSPAWLAELPTNMETCEVAK
jgi:hypothetical protein